MNKTFAECAVFVAGTSLLMAFAAPSALAKPKYGTAVKSKLYHVHSRVLWDAGWVNGCAVTSYGLPFNEFEPPAGTELCYGPNQTLFLGPFGYGAPDKPKKATRRVRLYVNYGHQMGCDGTITVAIGDVEFYLPLIGGFGGTMAAGWSNFREYSEFKHVGHSGISMYLKDLNITHGDCSSTPGAMRGSVYRIEMHYYDNYRKKK
jgi:hypothetical protein